LARLVAPLLVLLGTVFHRPIGLAFSRMEAASIAVAALVTSSMIGDPETNWLEGALLLLADSVFGVAFFFF
jgi:calcium/proton exchanger cax